MGNDLNKKATNTHDHQGLYVGKVTLFSEVPETEPQPEHPQPQERFFGWRSVFHIRLAIKKTAAATVINTRSCCIVSSKGLNSDVALLPLSRRAKIHRAVCAGGKAMTYSDLRHQDIGGGQGINAKGAAADLDHALLSSALTEQFQLRSRQDPKVCHLGAGLPVAVDGANP